MSLSVAEKQKVMADYRTSTNDTGSVEVQVSVLTESIKQLTEHFKTHQHDHHSKQGLMSKVNQRRKLLRYLKAHDIGRYRTLVSKLEIREI